MKKKDENNFQLQERIDLLTNEIERLNKILNEKADELSDYKLRT